MARPAKAIAAKTGAITKEEEKIRLETESALRGSEPPKPSRHLTKNQKKIFKEITNELIDANVLGKLDSYILDETARTIDSLRSLQEIAAQKPDVLMDPNYIRANSAYMKDFFRECNELCLSPQSRAKLSVSNVKAAENKERKTLMDIFNEDDDD